MKTLASDSSPTGRSLASGFSTNGLNTVNTESKTASRDSVMRILYGMAFEIWQQSPKNILSVIVTGSMGRGEATKIGNKILSDIDIFVVTRRLSPLFRSYTAEIVDKYQRLLPFIVEVSDMPLRNLKTQKSVALFEAKANGMVLYGDINTLSLISVNGPQDIPEWEGIRLLCNGLVELLESCLETGKPTAYAICKVYLRIGEAYLIFKRKYRPTYIGRLQELIQLDDLTIIPDFDIKFKISSELKLNQRTDCDDLSAQETIRDLLVALNYFLTLYLRTCDISLVDKLTVLSYRFCNWRHSVPYFLSNLRRGKVSVELLIREPCVLLWMEAMALLTKNSLDMQQVIRLISDWKKTPQYILA